MHAKRVVHYSSVYGTCLFNFCHDFYEISDVHELTLYAESNDYNKELELVTPKSTILARKITSLNHKKRTKNAVNHVYNVNVNA